MAPPSTGLQSLPQTALIRVLEGLDVKERCAGAGWRRPTPLAAAAPPAAPRRCDTAGPPSFAL